MSTKDKDEYDAFCQLQPAPRWKAFKAERERADEAEYLLAQIDEWCERTGTEMDLMA